MNQQIENPSTGLVYRRRKEAARGVVLADRAARRLISAGGTLVIGAILGIMIFLVIQVLPLFAGGTAVLSGRGTVMAPWKKSAASILEERHALAVEVGPEGDVLAYHPASGEAIARMRIIPDGATLSCMALEQDTGVIAAGLADGSVIRTGVDFTVETLPPDFNAAGLKVIGPGEWAGGGAVYTLTAQGLVRRVSIGLTGPSNLRPAGGAPAAAVAIASVKEGEGSRETVAVLDAGGGLSVIHTRSKKNIMTGNIKTSSATYPLPNPPEIPAKPRLLLGGGAFHLMLAGESGILFRYNITEPSNAFLAETVRLTPPGVKATAMELLSGRQSLVTGGSGGGVSIHFILRRPGAGSADGMRVALARSLEPHGGAVTDIAAGPGGKSFLTSGGSGIWLRHATSGSTLARLDNPAGAARALALAPGLDGALAAMEDGSTALWKINIRHPEASLRAFFGRMWYEGYPEPSFTWQSSGAAEEFEPKLSLVPLIFGTLKATFYAMLFAAPVALMAAVFTSEFLAKPARAPVKTAMEMMASLPSVVLGFVAAMVVAPALERNIGQALLAGLTAPLGLVLGALLWRLIPAPVADRLSGAPKMAAMAMALLAGLGLAAGFGGVFERLFFHGDFLRWLTDKNQGSAPFLIIILLPMMAGGVAVLRFRAASGAARARGRGFEAGLAGLLEAAEILATGAGLACAAAFALQWFGFDPRNFLVGPYVQRNTFIAAFAIGFAVIPIIYTIAEDALSSVPDHLRAASLGCGATVWQTAIWVTLPTAASGIFSALMIGMGRAVGETMIVVMAAGNTPLMELNVFSGLRALSANIAVELPEAVVGGTLYRTLFLSALVLFLMTFAINTAAEIVRIRFRRRYSRL